MDPYGLPASWLADTCRVSITTAHRWRRHGRIPPLPGRLVALAAQGELGAIWPAWGGFRIRDGELWTPYGFSVRPGEISALPYRFAQIRALERALETPVQGVLFR